MLTHTSHQGGVSLIELSAGLAILGVTMAVGIPDFVNWIRNIQIRTAAESIQSGLQLARTEAVRRNAPVRFSLTSTAGLDCDLSAAGVNWVVSLDDPSGKCANAPSETAAPRIIQARPAAEGAGGVTATTTQPDIRFNGIGKRSDAAVSTGATNIDISHVSGGNCASIGGPMRCLRVVVSAGGQIRMCDPAVNGADIRGC